MEHMQLAVHNARFLCFFLGVSDVSSLFLQQNVTGYFSKLGQHSLRLCLPPGFWVWIVQRVSGVVSQIKVADSPGGTPHTISIYRLCTLSGRVIGFYWSAFFFSTTCSFYAGIFFYSVTGLKYNRVQSQMYSKVKIDILYYRRYMCSNTITQVNLIPYFLTLKMESKIFK